MPPRASSVASATYADPQLGLESPDLAQQDSDDEGGGAGGGGGGAGDGEGEGELDEEDDPLVQQELEAFGSGAVEETLPAPPADPNLKILQQQQAAAELQAGGGAAGAAGSAGAGGKRTLAAGGGPLARAKRPKSVKHSPAAAGNKLARRAAPGLHGDFMLPNNDFCDSCGGKGHFLCCEGGCLRSFHFQCLEPPLEMDEVPDESWYCKACRASAHPPPRPPRTYFSDLVYKVETENPKQFSLTNELKGFFKHVASGVTGEFIDATEHRPPSKITGRAIGQEDRDGYRLKDKNGRSIICYNCDGSAQPAQQRRIISCDFCDQHWHLDCLDPPLTGMPPPTRKWMCPLHAEHLIPTKRSIKTLQTINIDKREQHNNGDIVIVPGAEGPNAEEVEEILVNRVRYQVPEKHVILDFWGRVSEGPRTRRKPNKPKKHRSPRKKTASGYESGNSSPLTDLTSSDNDSDIEMSTPAPSAPSAPPPTALNNLALLAEVRYIDYLASSSSSSSSATASTSAAVPNASAKDKGKARALPPALPASTQHRGPRPSLPATVVGAIPPHRGASPSVSPAPLAAQSTTPAPAKLMELAVDTKEDLQALMRVRKLIQAQSASKGRDGGQGSEGDAVKRATMIGFLEGEAILPKLEFIKSDAQPWQRPWEQQGGAPKPSPNQRLAPLPLRKPTPAAAASVSPSAAAPSASSKQAPPPAPPAPSSDLSSLPASGVPTPIPTPALPSAAATPAGRPALAPSESPLPFSLPVSTKTSPAPPAANGAGGGGAI